MTFAQIIEFRDIDIDAAQKVHEEWRRATEGKRTASREVLARDRSDPDRYFAIVFFDSYESAMKNSEMPETQAAAEEYRKLAGSPPVFHDLDVLVDQS